MQSQANLVNVKFQDREEKVAFLDEFSSLSNYFSADVLNCPNQVYNYCRACKITKPERTHHCSTCNKCYLKMDHHCPWIGNCVGYRNHKFFFMFLFYAFVASAIMFGTIIPYLVASFLPDGSYSFVIVNFYILDIFIWCSGNYSNVLLLSFRIYDHAVHSFFFNQK